MVCRYKTPIGSHTLAGEKVKIPDLDFFCRPNIHKIMTVTMLRTGAKRLIELDDPEKIKNYTKWERYYIVLEGEGGSLQYTNFKILLRYNMLRNKRMQNHILENLNKAWYT